jgi:hypothetical protein
MLHLTELLNSKSITPHRIVSGIGQIDRIFWIGRKRYMPFNSFFFVREFFFELLPLCGFPCSASGLPNTVGIILGECTENGIGRRKHERAPVIGPFEYIN